MSVYTDTGIMDYLVTIEYNLFWMATRVILILMYMVLDMVVIILLIDFINNLNNILMIYHEKFILKVSQKLDIILIHYINSFIMVSRADSTVVEVVLEQHPAK